MEKPLLSVIALVCFFAITANYDFLEANKVPPTEISSLQECNDLAKDVVVVLDTVNTLPQQENTNLIPHKFDVANSLPVSAYAAGAARKPPIYDFRRSAPGVFLFRDRTFIADVIEENRKYIVYTESLRFRNTMRFSSFRAGERLSFTRIVDHRARRYGSGTVRHLWHRLSLEATNPERFKIPYAFAFDLTSEEHALIETQPEKILEIIQGRKPILTWPTPEIQWSDRLRMRFLRNYMRTLRRNGFIDWAETIMELEGMDFLCSCYSANSVTRDLEELENMDYSCGCYSPDVALGTMDEFTAVAYFRDYIRILKGESYVDWAKTVESLEAALASAGRLTKAEFEIVLPSLSRVPGWEVTESGKFRIAAPDIFTLDDRVIIADITEENKCTEIVFSRSLQFRSPIRAPIRSPKYIISIDIDDIDMETMTLTGPWMQRWIQSRNHAFRPRIPSPLDFYYGIMFDRSLYDAGQVQELWAWLECQLSSYAANPERFKIPYAFAFDLTPEEHALIEAEPEKILEIVQGKRQILTWITPEIQWSDKFRIKFLRDYIRILRENGFVDWAETIERLEGIDYLNDHWR